MIGNILTLLQKNTWADMATGKMAAGAAAMRANSIVAEVVVSPRNQNIIWFSYGFAAALILVSLYFFILVRQRADVSEKKRSLIIGAASFAVALLLWILPAHFFPVPMPPENFDMRTT